MNIRLWTLKSTASASIINAHGIIVSECRRDTVIFRTDDTNRGICKKPEVLIT